MFINGKEQDVKKLSVKLWNNDTDEMLKEVIVYSEEEAIKVANDMEVTMKLKENNTIDFCINDDAVMQLV